MQLGKKPANPVGLCLPRRREGAFQHLRGDVGRGQADDCAGGVPVHYDWIDVNYPADPQGSAAGRAVGDFLRPSHFRRYLVRGRLPGGHQRQAVHRQALRPPGREPGRLPV